MTYIPFSDAKGIGDRFLALLNLHQINPPQGSNIENELLSLTQLVEVFNTPEIAIGAAKIELHRAAAGVMDFAAKVLSVQAAPDFNGFLPHLQLIAENKVRVASFGQNSAGAYNDDTARKMAELYIACLVAHTSIDVRLDSPTSAKGDNPDVMFSLVDEKDPEIKEVWALAIKTISSRQGQTIFERIKEGAAQIDAEQCPAQKGMVVINTKDALDHDTLATTTFSTFDEAMAALHQQIVDIAESANKDRPQDEWDNLFVGRVKRPVLLLGQSMVYLSTPHGQQTPTPLKMLVMYDANDVLDNEAAGLAKRLNNYMQRLFHGRLVPLELIQTGSMQNASPD